MQGLLSFEHPSVLLFLLSISLKHALSNPCLMLWNICVSQRVFWIYVLRKRFDAWVHRYKYKVFPKTVKCMFFITCMKRKFFIMHVYFKRVGVILQTFPPLQTRIHIPISSASLVDHAYSSSIFLQSSLSKFSQRIVIAKWNKTACKSCSEGLKSDMKLYFPWSDDNLSGRTLVYYAFTMPKS